MQNNVYKQCMDRYKLEKGNQDDCKDGARAFATKQTAECTSVTGDCTNRGTIAAEDVALTFCYAGLMKIGMRSPITPACEGMARRRCKSYVVNAIEDLIKQDGNCNGMDNINDLDFDDYEELDDLCDEEVDKWVDQSQLP